MSFSHQENIGSRMNCESVQWGEIENWEKKGEKLSIARAAAFCSKVQGRCGWSRGGRVGQWQVFGQEVLGAELRPPSLRGEGHREGPLSSAKQVK